MRTHKERRDQTRMAMNSKFTPNNEESSKFLSWDGLLDGNHKSPSNVWTIHLILCVLAANIHHKNL